MRTRRLSLLPPLLILLVVIFGGLAGFFAYLYFSQHPILLTSGEDAYNVLRDVILIVIAVLTVLTAVLIAILGWALRNMLLRDLRAELSGAIEECKNDFFSTLHMKVAPLWGRLYEHDKTATYLIDYAVTEAEKAVNYAREIDEKTHWELKGMALNNYLMALSERHDLGDTNLAYKVGHELEELLKKHKSEMPLHESQSTEETIYFSRYVLPRIGSKDREEAKQKLNSLKEHPRFDKWKQRWNDFEPLT
ncbi:MAG: hypothetical protein IMY77_00495 [Chloroflexi bacterium]|nr:hypothetical protein [Chloroflexota bacterium]